MPSLRSTSTHVGGHDPSTNVQYNTSPHCFQVEAEAYAKLKAPEMTLETYVYVAKSHYKVSN